MGSHIFGFYGVRQFFIFTVSKRTRMFVRQMKSKVLFVQSKTVSQFIKIESGNREKLHICPKMTKMGSIIGHRIDYNGVYVGALRGQRHIPSKN